MDHPPEPLTLRLRSKGLTSDETHTFLRDVGMIYSAEPGLALSEFNRRLASAGWDRLELDEDTLNAVLVSFQSAGMNMIKRDTPIIDLKDLQRLLVKIHEARGADFRGYSKTSLARRINGRILDSGAQTYSQYSELLDRDPHEYERLFDAITINVTQFLRNRAAFKALEKAIRSRLREKANGELRIWSAGCATGQEPYTMAMLMADLVEQMPSPWISILATDIDAKARALAQRGFYERDLVSDVPADWLKRFFIAEKEGFTVKPGIRSMIRFEPHNLVSDEPNHDQDVIVCRNVLMYFNFKAQMLVAQKLHESLRDGGYLLLGRYEMLTGQARRMFRCVDFDARLYRRV